MKTGLLVSGLAAMMGIAPAIGDVVIFSYSSTVNAFSNYIVPNPPTPPGESFTLRLALDNGGSSLISQTWGAAHFVSLSGSTAGGYTWSTTAGTTFDSGNFATDGLGNVSAVGEWRNFILPGTAPVITSQFGPSLGAWAIDGTNQVLLSNGINTSLGDASVTNNQNPASWSAALAIPEPSQASVAALVLSGALLGSRRRKPRR